MSQNPNDRNLIVDNFNNATPQERENLLRGAVNRVSVAWKLLWDKRTGIYPRLILIAGLAYLILPFDLLPAMVVGVFGGLDDAGVILTALAMFYQAVPEDLVNAVQAEIDKRRALKRGDIIEGTSSELE